MDSLWIHPEEASETARPGGNDFPTVVDRYFCVKPLVDFRQIIFRIVSKITNNSRLPKIMIAFFIILAFVINLKGIYGIFTLEIHLCNPNRAAVSY